MKASEKKIFIMQALLIITLLLNTFVFKIFNIYVLSLVNLLGIGIVSLIAGLEQNRQRFQKDTIISIVSYILIYYVFIYLFGLIVGFVKSAYGLNIITILRNIIPITMFILTLEFFRYFTAVKAQKNKILLFLLILILVMFDLTYELNFYDMFNKKDLVELFCSVLLPSISKNIVLTYITIKYGYKVPIIYSLFMNLPIYILPIHPDFNIYLQSVFNFLLPLIILYRMRRDYTKKERNISVHSRRNIMIARIAAIIFLVIIIGLNSGVFKYFTLVVGSGSMRPNLYVGDILIVEKVKQDKLKILKKGDILIYKYGDKVISHRIVKINKDNNGMTFITKGDNNEEIDNWIIEERQVIGRSRYKIPLIGYPTIWLNEKIN